MTTLRPRPGAGTAVDAPEPLYSLDVMNQDDVPEVSRVERRCFANPWPASAYRRELQNPGQNFYVVVRESLVTARKSNSESEEPKETNVDGSMAPVKPVPRRALLPISLGRRQDSGGQQRPAIIGFAGMWLAFDEAHVTTIGVDPTRRGQGLGELLLLCMFDEALNRGANWLTLEVRVTNAAAQALYRKYGFSTHGTRKRYYSDNNEDALIMWSPALNDPEFRATLESRRIALERRLGGRIEPDGLSPFSDSMRRTQSP
ncbi:MAG: ribosomal protein S18-alanine N-acetyltransferase [Chloroflexi bacterium]|nr:ribosomal protein S18-alanine N-acetyltransferase [Chloroflexota bacterium]